MTLCFYTKTIYALLEILGFLLLQMTTSENHDLLMPQKRARGSRQGMDTISRIRNSCSGVPLSSEPKRTPKPVRANLGALERRWFNASLLIAVVLKGDSITCASRSRSRQQSMLIASKKAPCRA